MLALNNVASADAYPVQGQGCSLGPSYFATGLSLTSFNASIVMQLLYRDPQSSQGIRLGPEFTFPPAGQVWPGALGFIARSAVAGVPAQVVAQVYEVADGPLPTAPVPITVALSSGGIVSVVGGFATNVKDYGAKGDGVTDDAAAIRLAYAALPSSGGTLFFPQGKYIVGSQLAFTAGTQFTILGAGPSASIIAPSFAAGDAIFVNGPGLFSISEIAINPTLNRNAGTYLLHVKTAARVLGNTLYLGNTLGGLLMFESVNFLQLVNCQGDSTDGVSTGDTCLRIKACGGTISNCYFRSNNSAGSYSRSPCLWITGQTTSLKIANCGFSGGGPHSKWTVQGISSGAGSFTVTTTAVHDFQTGDILVLRGNTPAAYNDVWRIASVTATTITVNTSANPGASTINGTAESLSACALVTNLDGAVNESSISNCLFEALTPNRYGSVGLCLDGRRGAAVRTLISGWNIDGNYYDFGASGLMLSGTTSGNAANDPTLGGISVQGGTFTQMTRAVWLDQVTDVELSGLTGSPPQTGIVGDSVSQPAALYIYAGPAAPFTQGITVSGCNLGQPRFWNATNPGYSFGILLDSPGIQDLAVSGCQLFGSNLAVGEANAPEAAGQRWLFRSNWLAVGAFPIANTTVIPSVASAATLNINPYHDFQKVTGVTSISTINPGWVGRELTLLFVSGLTLLTGGNLAIGANYAVLAGQLVRLVHDGTSWYLK